MVRTFELGLGLASGSVKTRADAVNAMQTFKVLSSGEAIAAKNMAIHSMTTRLQSRVPQVVGGATEFDRLIALVNTALDSGLSCPPKSEMTQSENVSNDSE